MSELLKVSSRYPPIEFASKRLLDKIKMGREALASPRDGLARSQDLKISRVPKKVRTISV